MMETCCEFIHIKKNGADGTAYPLTKGTVMLGRFAFLSSIWIYIYILSFCSDKECDFRIQLPSVCDKHVKIDIDGNGKVNDFTNQ